MRGITPLLPRGPPQLQVEITDKACSEKVLGLTSVASVESARLPSCLMYDYDGELGQGMHRSFHSALQRRRRRRRRSANPNLLCTTCPRNRRSVEARLVSGRGPTRGRLPAFTALGGLRSGYRPLRPAGTGRLVVIGSAPVRLTRGWPSASSPASL